MNDYKELLIGCGHSRNKRIIPPSSHHTDFVNLTTLDNNPACNPDVLCDLADFRTNVYERHAATGKLWRSLMNAFPTGNTFDEIHAYEVLEHIGRQGDYALFFAQFREFYRMLKPGGYFCATVPHWQSLWAWGDPGHTRVINEGTITFLDRREYERQIGKTSMSDYRAELEETNFEIVSAQTKGQTFAFVLRAIK
jgi:cyclopropane fatty-acyl-phospholipid synthase-like methyltransferase